MYKLCMKKLGKSLYNKQISTRDKTLFFDKCINRYNCMHSTECQRSLFNFYSMN